jgi:hypothetical protein
MTIINRRQEDILKELNQKDICLWLIYVKHIMFQP